MFSHVTVGTNDFDRALAFYDAVLPTVGLARRFYEPEFGWVGYALPLDGKQAMFFVGLPYDGEAATVGNGVTVAFNADTRAQVDAFHAAALAAGGTDEGEPGLRPHYHPNYYGAYVRDLDGHKLCCVCHAPA